MPGATETDFFERADMMDTKLGSSDKAHASDVAKTGLDAMMEGELKVVAGFGNKLRAAVSHVAPDSALAEIHRGMAKPGSGKTEEPKSKRERTDPRRNEGAAFRVSLRQLAASMYVYEFCLSGSAGNVRIWIITRITPLFDRAARTVKFSS